MSKSRKARPRSEPKAAGPAPSQVDPSAQGTLGNAALLASMGPQDVGKEDAPTIAGVANQIPLEPHLSTANQLSKVVVRGYDPVKKKEIVGTAQPSADLGKDEEPKLDPTKKKR